MKIKGLLLGMLACAAMVACTNEDIVENNDSGNQENNTAYMSVKVSMPRSAGSRAAAEFEDGISTEQTISNAYCFFFTESGDFSTSTKLGALTFKPGGTSGDNVEATTVATIMLGNTTIFPTQIVTLLNIGDAKYAELKGLSLNELLEKTAASTDGFAADNNFIMSNSTYVNGESKIVNTTKVTASDYYASQQEALNAGHPISIYVERLAAKVNITEDDQMKNTTPVTPGKHKLTLVIDGWTLNGVNKGAYYVKNLNLNWATTAPFTGWNEAANFRCYWANDKNYASGTYPANFETGSAATGGNDLIYHTWNDAKAMGTAQYCLENTMDAASASSYAKTTHALVLGHYLLDDKEIPAGTAFYIYANNEIFLESDLLATMANLPNIYKETAGTRTKLTPADYNIVRATDSEGKIIADQVTIVPKVDNITYYKKTGDNQFEGYANFAAATAAVRTAVGTATVYFEGACYFPVQIKHLAAQGEGAVGVVRNHVYKLNITAIKSLGVGVYNKDEVIVPTTPTTQYYLAAELNVLAWRTISTDIEL